MIRPYTEKSQTQQSITVARLRRPPQQGKG
jgi:hypothetical protein